MDPPLFDLARREIVDFHAAVQRWFSGVETGPADLSRILQALASDFSMTTPDGNCIAEPLVTEWLRGARGCRSADFRIRIEHMRRVVEQGDIMALVYDECQNIDGQDTRRHATAIFRRAPSAPCGVHWQRVHETWASTE